MQLRDYQKEILNQAYQIIQKYRIVYLAMEVRTGKTITALSLAKVLNCARVLFITKKKAISSIESDYEKSSYNFSLTVRNYESLHKLSTHQFDLVIIDEAHSLGAYPKPSLQTKRIKEIVGNKMVVLLSGTPSPESYSQLYHQFWISDSSPFKNYKNFYRWSDEFVIKKMKVIGGYRINDYSKARKDLIDAYVSKYFITYTQKEAGFEANVNETVKYIPINPHIYKLSDILSKQRYFKMKDGSEIVCDTAAKLKSKLHQVYSGTVITEEGKLKVLDNSKAEFIKKEYEGRKIAIFYQFRAEGEVLKATFPNWTDITEDFNNNDDLIYISQVQSGSMGTNLSTADVIVFYNINYSSLQYWQSRARSQHLKRKEDSQIHWIFAEDGIEKEIYKAVINKKDFTTSYFKKVWLKG